MKKEEMVALEFYICEKGEIVSMKEEELNGVNTIYLEGERRPLPYYIHDNGSVLGFFGVMGVITSLVALFFQETESGKHDLMLLYRRKGGYGKYCIGHTKNKIKAEEWEKRFKTFFKKGAFYE